MSDIALSLADAIGLPVVDAVLLLLLLFGCIFYFLVRIGRVSQEATGSELHYEVLPIAWPSIIIVWALLSLALRFLTAIFSTGLLAELHQGLYGDASKALFVVYFLGFVAMWTVYFVSPWNSVFFKVRTLRTLLSELAINWKDMVDLQQRKQRGEQIGALPHVDGFDSIQQKKATSSISALAILAASAAVVLSLSNEQYQNLADKNVHDGWTKLTLMLSIVTALVSFYCFVVAADILDTVFNKFEHDVELKLMRHFYFASINPKYGGLILLIISLALFMAARQPALGALALGCVTFVGYGHWFPRLNPRVGLQKLEWLMRASLVGLPIYFALASA